jgi:hypothetical protein
MKMMRSTFFIILSYMIIGSLSACAQTEARADSCDSPRINGEFSVFTDSLDVEVTTDCKGVEIRYTLDGNYPMPRSELATGPVRLTRTAVLSARCFRGGRAVSGAAQAFFRRVKPRAADAVDSLRLGVIYAYYEGDWDKLPDFAALTPLKTGTLETIDFAPRNQADRFAFVYSGYFLAPETGSYLFMLGSDEGSRLYIGGDLVIDNDGLHVMNAKTEAIALSQGCHRFRLEYFEKDGDDDLRVEWKMPGRAATVLRPHIAGK